MTTSLTVSLKADEVAKITEYMQSYNLKRHEVIKLAIRHFLFPTENPHPLNGKQAEVKPNRDIELVKDNELNFGVN